VAKRPSTEEALAAIRAIRDAPEQFDLKRDLAPFLTHKSNHAAAAAADTIGWLEITGMNQELVDSFGHWMKNPLDRDPGCKALTAIAKALIGLEHPASEVYFAGVRHIQEEASYGPPVDTAAALRGLCAQGLARMSHPDALSECVKLLVDPEVAARAGAARAISESGQYAGVLLLRLKALIGDKAEDVLAECFAGLLRLAPKESVEFVAQFLQASPEEVSERAALALGESRLAAALPFLQEAFEQTAYGSLRKTLLLSIAMLRQDDGLDFLLAHLAEDSEQTALDTLEALSIYGRDQGVGARVRGILTSRNSPALIDAFRNYFQG